MIVVARGILGRAEGQPKPAPRRLVIDDCVILYDKYKMGCSLFA